MEKSNLKHPITQTSKTQKKIKPQTILKQNSPQNRYNKPEKILTSQDRRKKAPHPTTFPFAPTGLITMKFKKTLYSGTGILINPSIVLTAASNLYDRPTKTFATEITFTPAKTDSFAKFGIYKILEFRLPSEYVENEEKNEEEDFAILILEKKSEFCAGEYTGFFGVKVFRKVEDFLGGFISVFGYGGDKGHQIWGMRVRVSEDCFRVRGGVLEYDVDTFGGMSGSGVVLENCGEFFVVAVHVRGGFGFNEGTLITERRFGIIEKWIQEAMVKYKDVFNPENLNLKTEIGITKINPSKKKLPIINYERILENFLKKNLNDLEVINLNNINIKVKGIENILNEKLDNLKVLRLSKTHIEVEEIEYLTKLELKNLERLNLSYNNIRDEGIIHLSKIQLDNLEELDLSKTNIGNEGMKYLSLIKFKNLEILYLNNNKIGNKGIEYLSKIKLDNLKRLDLFNNNIEDEGINYLMKMKLYNLVILDINKNRIGIKSIEKLSKNYPLIKIYHIDMF